MKHFNEGLWADFVRGVLDDALRTEMELHLRTGCAGCQATVDWMREVEAVASIDRTVEIPQEWITRALEVFPQGAVRNNWIQDLATTMAELIFQTGPDWRPAGVRSAAGTTVFGVDESSPAAGRVVYRAGDYRVDVSFETPSANEPGEIVGQISCETDPSRSVEGFLVQAASAESQGRLLGETTANRFGEFVMDYPFVERATLRIASRERGLRIEFPLGVTRQSSGPKGVQ